MKVREADRGKYEVRVCTICGDEFQTRIWNKAKCCSGTCANLLRMRPKRDAIRRMFAMGCSTKQIINRKFASVSFIRKVRDELGIAPGKDNRAEIVKKMYADGMSVDAIAEKMDSRAQHIKAYYLKGLLRDEDKSARKPNRALQMTTRNSAWRIYVAYLLQLNRSGYSGASIAKLLDKNPGAIHQALLLSRVYKSQSLARRKASQWSKTARHQKKRSRKFDSEASFVDCIRMRLKSSGISCSLEEGVGQWRRADMLFRIGDNRYILEAKNYNSTTRVDTLIGQCVTNALLTGRIAVAALPSDVPIDDDSKIVMRDLGILLVNEDNIMSVIMHGEGEHESRCVYISDGSAGADAGMGWYKDNAKDIHRARSLWVDGTTKQELYDMGIDPSVIACAIGVKKSEVLKECA